MTVYVDALRNYGWRLGPSCHLVADTEDELHAFAARLGMKRAWFQAPPKVLVAHYDLVASKRERAVALGAVELDRLAFVNVTRRLRGLQPIEAQKAGGEGV